MLRLALGGSEQPVLFVRGELRPDRQQLGKLRFK